MNLRKQLFTAFLTVAILPLLIVSIYMFVTNLMLAFELHQRNLQESTQIQADLVGENLNRLMVRGKQFVSSRVVGAACREDLPGSDTTEALAKDILNFTDETLDSVTIFALLNQKGDVVYSSGSNSDNRSLMDSLPKLQGDGEGQYVSELPFDGAYSLVIHTPVQENGETVGSFLIVCRTDYLLKIISGHQQVGDSNALIYCMEHKETVLSKQDVSTTLPELDNKISGAAQGSLLCSIGGSQTLVYYQKLPKVDWVLVSTISIGQIFSQIGNYGVIHAGVLLVVFLIILFLSRRQSREILRPMDQLLAAVETFFLAGAAKFPKTEIDSKTEIGYLAEKFSGMSDEITLAQGKLRESNYLYAALLQATFEFRIVIDFLTKTVECSDGSLQERFRGAPGENVSEQLLVILAEEDGETEQKAFLRRIAYGKFTGPVEAQAYFAPKEQAEKAWYRVVAVPVVQNGAVVRSVLHFEDITEQKREELRLIHSSQTDPLCGLFNRTAFLQRCRRTESGGTDAVFFIDLDHFKQVNDTLGHRAGDDILVSVAQAIRRQFRESDVIGRFGGDEFVVFADGVDEKIAEKRAMRLVQEISFYLNNPRGTEIHVTASVGVCLAAAATNLEQAIQLADEAMYQVKENHRGEFHIIRADKEK